VLAGRGEGAMSRGRWYWWRCVVVVGQERVVAEVEIAFAHGSSTQLWPGSASPVHGLDEEGRTAGCGVGCAPRAGG